MHYRRILSLALAFSLAPTLMLPVHAQDDNHYRGRKYKAPPETSHLEVLVLKGFNQKPIVNAAVVFRPILDGKEIGTLEVKTDPDGKATIDVIPKGSTVTLQVIADGFATHAEDFVLSDSRSIVVKMLRPQAQISAYEDNRGKVADRPAGVQEKVTPAKPAVSTPPQL
ncbi:carboxypeptidase regulatory-like domain-containing protein [Granulicella sp. WH15]|uniref:carboxypeptidase-like regulatory domain-containing protein n=1 Tax=Granulicella sp. WH15 TaxID=2602070 RepID=UPI0013675C3F|nr:carboxypeptidase-like regulatory domain-containing protein [Granulicella sp. WH15]QHN03297.1 carboxypeptidase regulatory-like domain-containing protein [Granulicella sp. WH15]